MSKINTKHFKVDIDKCEYSILDQNNNPYCVYFDTNNGLPHCRKGCGTCISVERILNTNNYTNELIKHEYVGGEYLIK